MLLGIVAMAIIVVITWFTVYCWPKLEPPQSCRRAKTKLGPSELPEVPGIRTSISPLSEHPDALMHCRKMTPAAGRKAIVAVSTACAALAVLYQLA